jgi:putative MATE family efflux protein
MRKNLILGPILSSMLAFAVPMILGDLLQQCYNIADTLIVSRYLGPNALAAVGSSFTLMTFLTSILLGLCMGSGAVFSIRYGQSDATGLRRSAACAFVLTAVITAALTLVSFLCLDGIRVFLNVSDPEIWKMMRSYLAIVFLGIAATFLYNYFACYLRAIGDSVTPLVFLAIAAVLNIGLDLLFIVGLKRGVAGAATATVLSQYLSGIGLGIFTWFKDGTGIRTRNGNGRLVTLSGIREIAGFSILTCVQQSIMNLGILMVQGLVNSFGPAVMAAFAAAVKIDAFAYLPVQDFGNACSTFLAQNYGAREEKRIRKGLRAALAVSGLFSLAVSAFVFVFAGRLMGLFVKSSETAIIQEGVRYLRIEGAFYIGIGCLFLLYGLYRALEKPGMSVVLTVISLGTRVALAYLLSAQPSVGVVGIWWSVPIGWFLADLVGLLYYAARRRYLLSWKHT